MYFQIKKHFKKQLLPLIFNHMFLQSYLVYNRFPNALLSRGHWDFLFLLFLQFVYCSKMHYCTLVFDNEISQISNKKILKMFCILRAVFNKFLHICLIMHILSHCFCTVYMFYLVVKPSINPSTGICC